MGEAIAESRFHERDFVEFFRRLRMETDLLHRWLEEGVLASGETTIGLEIEGWLVGKGCAPLPVNEQFLALVKNPLVVEELGKCNIELNVSPQKLSGSGLRVMQEELGGIWQECKKTAGLLGAEALLIGILPTLQLHDLRKENMTPTQRYAALDDQIGRMRRRQPHLIEITGEEDLRFMHEGVMVEAATTSLQLHLQVSPAQAAHFYNIALLVSAPLVAASGNSPFLFGHSLWDETRIPLFEQALAVDGVSAPEDYRVTFGTGFLTDSIAECFQENMQKYAIVLPVVWSDGPERMHHLRLHNGTVWRWNRPLIGFDAEGCPHVRIEHRVMSAGPTILDSMANAAFFFGLMYGLAGDLFTDPLLPPVPISFAQTRANFYAAAQHGLRALLMWGKKTPVNARELLLKELLPLAREALVAREIDNADIDLLLGIVEDRVRSGRTGAVWQRACAAHCDGDLRMMTQLYCSFQKSGAPVHEWGI